MRHISEILPSILNRLRPEGGGAQVINLAAARRARGLEPVDSMSVRNIGGRNVITIPLGGQWYWALDLTPEARCHGPFRTADDALDHAVGELIYGEPS